MINSLYKPLGNFGPLVCNVPETQPGPALDKSLDMRQKKKIEFLTEVELEFMTLLWKHGEGSVRDVLANMAAGS